MKLVITISGFHGTGKSTYAKALAEEFGLRFVSSGMVFRQIALERGVSPEGLSRLAMKDKRIDLLIDERTKEEAKKGSVVLDGHLAGWMAKDYADVRIFLTAPSPIRAQRIANRNRIPIKEAEHQMLTIERIEGDRWKKFYKINLANQLIYDVVLNTGLLPLESVIKILKAIVREYIQNRRRQRRCQ